MTTLIAVYDSDGCVGRCDARCYNAKTPDCDCICGGKNHAVGINKAGENTMAMAQSWIDRYNQQHPGEKLSFKVNPSQMELAL